MRAIIYCFCFVIFLSNAESLLAEEVTMTVSTTNVVKQIKPGAVGWGAMWKQEMLYPSPGTINTDAEHQAYLEQLANEGRKLAQAADLRNISWPWGVSFFNLGRELGKQHQTLVATPERLRAYFLVKQRIRLV